MVGRWVVVVVYIEKGENKYKGHGYRVTFYLLRETRQILREYNAL